MAKRYFYKNIANFGMKSKIEFGLFEIIDGKTTIGYSVRKYKKLPFGYNKRMSLKPFFKGYFGQAESDSSLYDYGQDAWDFVNRENALNMIKEMGLNEIKK